MSNSEAAKEKVVGGLVWVKRRNGTWWPGQILDINDVPESCLASKKGPGAPVKLLGKQDATIEWFKIEKSKRIKEFRCPESVKWLKRGKTISALNSDKAVIYAKRKDAISEALQIEAEQTNICSDMPISAAKQDESKRLPSDKEDETERSPSDKKVDQLSHSGSSSETADSMELTPEASGQGSPNGRSKGVPRTRPLEDFGLGIPSKRRRIPTQKASEYMKTKESDSKSSEAPPNLPIVRENLAGLSSTYISSPPQILPVGAAAQSSHGNQVENVSLGYDELTESGSAPSGAATTVIMCRGIEERNPEWNMKRKRNFRRAIKSEWCWGNIERRSADAALVTSQRLIGNRQSDSTIIREYQPIDVRLGGLYDPPTNLFDVDLIVNARSRPQNVPYISLLSKLNHKPIIGHALNVEALDDGFCDDPISGPSCYIGSSNEDEYEDESAARKRKPDPRGRKTGKRGPYKPRKEVTPFESPRYCESGPVQRTIRRISSLLAASQEQRVEEVQNELVTKPKVSTVGCVPLKTVFSRLNAALNC